MFGAFSVLAVERDALWLLFTFPVPLARILRRKVVLWACIAATYCGVGLAIFWRPGPAPDVNTLVSPFVALIGIFLFAFYAAGLGCLGTDPLEQIAQKRVKPAWMYLYMSLAGLYGFGIYSGVLWSKAVLIVLMALLTSAIWQKVYERLPLLLDPTQLPPPRLSLSDGLIAALLFFVFQAAISLPLLSVAELPPGAVAAIAYPVAGVLTAGIMLIAFLRMRIPRLGATLGLGAGPSPARGLALGVAAGAGCALFAFCYLLLVGQVEPLREWRDQAMQRAIGENPLAYWPLLLLYVAAAPLFEEFIFRGLIFQGLARTMPVARAVVANGVIFAIVHPPIAFPAVFLLGVVTALVFRRTRSLWPAILTHAVYNGLVVLVGSMF